MLEYIRKKKEKREQASGVVLQSELISVSSIFTRNRSCTSFNPTNAMTSTRAVKGFDRGIRLKVCYQIKWIG